MTHYKLVLSVFPFLLITALGMAQSTSHQSSQFNLVIFGDNLETNSIEIRLKVNPGTEQHWQKVEEKANRYSDSEYTTLTYKGLSSEKYAGQDIRENYIAVKIRVLNKNETKVRGLYALPHLECSQNNLEKIHEAIKSSPEQIHKHTIAKVVYPRPQSLSADKDFTEHIEMPVRHLKPGVQEVRWLDIIFSDN